MLCNNKNCPQQFDPGECKLEDCEYRDNPYLDIAVAVSEVLNCAKAHNCTLEDIINIFKISWHLQSVFDVMWEIKENKKDED